MSEGAQTTSRPVVVVGYDGSDASRAAVERGIDRAAPSGRLVVVHSYHVPADFIGASYYQVMLDTAAEQAAAVMAELERDCPRLREVDYEPDLVAGAPAEAISRAAEIRGADEIVLGTRGVGRMRALLGSVAHEVIHRANCPVTVIPERMVDRAGAQTVAVPAVA
jgi:nucleotide-binding universal stress UspA family protein